jgi:hypothetical protein
MSTKRIQNFPDWWRRLSYSISPEYFGYTNVVSLFTKYVILNNKIKLFLRHEISVLKNKQKINTYKLYAVFAVLILKR